MFAIATGHRPESPGFPLENGSSEYLEALVWVERLATLVGSDCLVVPPGTTAQKARWINQARPSFAMEVHFSTDSKAEYGPRIAYHPASYESQGMAEALCSILEGHGAECEPGYYRKSGSIDFFLNSVSATSVIFMPGHITETTTLSKKKAKICLDVAAFIEQITRR